MGLRIVAIVLIGLQPNPPRVEFDAVVPVALAGAVTLAAIVAAVRGPQRAMRLIGPAIAMLGLIVARAVRSEGLWLTVAGLALGLVAWAMTARRAFALAGVIAAAAAVTV